MIHIASLVTGHANTLSVNDGIGFVKSTLYTPFRVAVFHALSHAHRYNVCHHAAGVIVFPSANDAPAVHADGVALSQTYLEYKRERLSFELRVIVGVVFLHVAELLFALTVGFV